MQYKNGATEPAVSLPQLGDYFNIIQSQCMGNLKIILSFDITTWYTSF
jgi:hypothetical protein